MPNNLYSAWISDIFIDVLTDEEAYVYNPVDGFQFTAALIIQKRSISCSKCASRFNVKMLDANQQWEMKEAIEWVTKPADFKPRWIKEPSFPDGTCNYFKATGDNRDSIQHSSSAASSSCQAPLSMYFIVILTLSCCLPVDRTLNLMS